MTRVFLAADGERDIGPPDELKTKLHDEDGALGWLVYRILEQKLGALPPLAVVCGVFPKIHDAVADIAGSRRPAAGYRSKLDRMWTLAVYKNCEAAVVVVDRDSMLPKERLHDLRDARDHASQEGATLAGRTAVGEARRCFEAWLISCPEAVADALGGTPPDLPKDPEGQRDPKAVLEGWLADSSATKDDYWRAYASLAKHARVSLVESRCPRSFRPFAKEVQERIGPLFAGSTSS